MVWLRRRRSERAKASGWYPSSCAMARICWRVAAATFCESGASLSTIETVDTENPQARATSSNVTCPDFRWATFPSPRCCLPRSLLRVRRLSDILPQRPGPRLALATHAAQSPRTDKSFRSSRALWAAVAGGDCRRCGARCRGTAIRKKNRSRQIFRLTGEKFSPTFAWLLFKRLNVNNSMGDGHDDLECG